MKKNANAWLRRIERLELGGEFALARMRKHPAVRLASTMAQIGDQPPLAGAAALALVVGLLRSDARLCEAAVRLGAALAITTAVKSGIEHNVTRTRPNAVLDGKRYKRKFGGSGGGGEKSFPSGHSADAVAAARAITRVYPELAGPIWGAAAFVILAQLPSGAHYPSDLVGGAAVGLLGEEAAHLLLGPALGQDEPTGS